MMGGVLVVMQGGVVGRLTRRFGEKRVAIGGVCSYLVGLALLAFSEPLAFAVLGGVFCGIGAGAYNPSVSSLVSKQAEAHERGVIMGGYQSATSLARVIGPALSGAIYTGVALNAPYIVGIVVSLPAIFLILRSQRGLELAGARQL